MTHTGVVIGKNKNLQVILCSECGYSHLFPLPEQKELDKYYEKEFYQQEKKNWLKENKEDWNWVLSSLRMEFGLLGLPAKGNNLFLDVGAGFGVCMLYAKDMGWDVEGLEPSPFACEILEKLDLKWMRGTAEESNMGGETADVIRAAWVLEHLLNPGTILDKFYKTLKRTGRLLLTVPNDFTNIQVIAKRELKKKNDWWLHKSHINYFNLKSLNILLRKHGFQIAQFYSTYPMELFLLQGFDYIDNPKLGRKLHKQRMEMEMAMHKTEQGIVDLVHLQQSYAGCGMGRDLVVMAVKNG